ncbi:MAG: transposase [Lachnospiraceae bacterium]|nr:transposase [Lachnospiraceae bacterium]
MTGDLLKAQLRDGTLHCSNDADKFMEPLFQEYMERGIATYLRGDSGFSSPKLYKTCEMNGCSYAICLKQNSSLVALASDKDEDLYKATKEEQISYAVTYGEFLYQAGSWEYPRRVVFKIEKPYGQLIHRYTFIVTNMDMDPYQIIRFYCGRGKMENFIKEGKSEFDFAAVSSHSKVVNANRMRLHMLAYNFTGHWRTSSN